ncbi:type III secretion system ATPase SctN [Pseudomonas aeruginosa]|nr:type III secretion system ATPase SctN [Pseudomonas aeruginosa]
MPAPLSPLIVRMRHAIEGCRPIQIRGRVTQVTGTLLKAVVPGVRIGELCQLRNPDQSLALLAEVIGFQQHQALLTPLGEMLGVSSNTEVSPTGGMHRVAVGEHLLGQVLPAPRFARLAGGRGGGGGGAPGGGGGLDGLGRPFDGSPPAEPAAWYPVYRDAPPPMSRRLIERPLSLGVRAIDGLLTCGEGQRMGIFAAAGGGKSTLLASLVRNAEVDVTVLALVGERGREVREFIESDLGEQGLRRSVLVVATSDRPAMERAKAGFVATSIAEYFRDQGRRVLLLMDSLTRFARAQREIGLAAGEPPTRRGYPPSVFAALPRLMERAGQSERGSITALYTVLVEGDDMSEPVADETRSILDGHIVLSRKLAAANHYPAIDVLHSVSRVMNQIVDDDQRHAAGRLREWLAKYEEVELLLKIGEYQKGQDSEADRAIEKIAAIRQWLRQGTHETSDYAQACAQLRSLCA